MLHAWHMHASHLLAADLAGGTVLACAAALFMIRLQAERVSRCIAAVKRQAGC